MTDEIAVQKIFLIFNTAHMGDALLSNGLCQNIKKIWPDSKTVFVVNKPFYEIARFQKDVDDVIVFDKDGSQKSLFARLKFVWNFPYKNIYCTILPHRDKTNSWIVKMIGAKHLLIKTEKEYKEPIQIQNINMLKKLTDKKIENFPIKFIAYKNIPEKFKDFINPNKKYIALCTISKPSNKNMPVETAIELTKLLNKDSYTIIYFGIGQEASDYGNTLTESGCQVINLVNKTSISEMASILLNCKALVSIDTGPMHLGCALNIPTTAVFYIPEASKIWAPCEGLYKTSLLEGNPTPLMIYNSLNTLLDKTSEV